MLSSGSYPIPRSRGSADGILPDARPEPHPSRRWRPPPRARAPHRRHAPPKQAEMRLPAGRKASNGANPAFAADRFREFLTKFGGHKDAHAARYGLGLALLEMPNPDLPKAVEALAPPANEVNFPDRPRA